MYRMIYWLILDSDCVRIMDQSEPTSKFTSLGFEDNLCMES